MKFGTGKRLTRRTSMLTLAGAAGAVLAACGEVEVRYVQGPAGPAGPSGQQGARGGAGTAGTKGAAGSAGQTIVIEKEKPIIVEKVVGGASAGQANADPPILDRVVGLARPWGQR